MNSVQSTHCCVLLLCLVSQAPACVAGVCYGRQFGACGMVYMPLRHVSVVVGCQMQVVYGHMPHMQRGAHCKMCAYACFGLLICGLVGCWPLGALYMCSKIG